MAWTNKEDYTNYHRKYKRKQRAKLKASGLTVKGEVPKRKPKMTNEQEIDNFSSVMEQPEVRKIVDTVKEATKDEETGEQDQLIKTLDTVQKYAPLVKTVLGGLMQGLQSVRPAQAQQQIASPEPVGYRSFSAKPPLEQLKIRHNNPQLVAQYEAYENALSGAVAPTYQQDQAQQSAYERKMASVNPQPSQELYGTPDFGGAPAQPPQIVQPSPEEKKQADAEFEQMVQQNRVSEKPTEKVEPSKPQEPQEPRKDNPVKEEKGEDELNQIKTAIQQDVEEQLNKALSFVANMSDEDFMKHVENPTGFMTMAKAYKQFGMSVQMKEALKQSSVEDITALFKTQCEAKYTLIEKNEKVAELQKLLGELVG